MRHTTESFIKRAREIHGDKFDYSKVVYGKTQYEKVTIICPIHGEFRQKPFDHMRSRSGNTGCPKCALQKQSDCKRITQEDFIKRSINAHGDKYDYSRSVYGNTNKDKVIIGCPKHGWFEQAPIHHMQGEGCKRCGCENSPEQTKKEAEDFIRVSKKHHNNKYDYSKVKYKASHEKVIIICPKHGEFSQRPASHKRGMGCRKCADEKTSNRILSNTKDFIQKAKKLHGNLFDYSKSKYTHSHGKLIIGCKIHGDFKQTPTSHLMGHGCKKCAIEITQEKQKDTTKSFIEKAKKVHGNKYDYSKTIYGKSQKDKVTIICREHGEYKTLPRSHLIGNKCPKCSMTILDDGFACTSLAEAYYYIKNIENKHTDFKYNKKYPAAKSGKDLGRSRYDFYIPSTNTYVEITAFRKGMNIYHKNGWDTYYEKIKRKQRYVENELHANFEFFQIEGLNKEQLELIAERTKGPKNKTDVFIKKAKKTHGNKYDYSLATYISQSTNVKIICPKHGVFEQLPNTHLTSKGCKKCHRVQEDEFIQKARKIHGDRYDYSDLGYKSTVRKVKILCPTHGYFYQTPHRHLLGSKCKGCAADDLRSTTEAFVTKSKEIYADKYDYSKVDYKSSNSKVCIICPEHGEFLQRPHEHLRKTSHGCPKCGIIKSHDSRRMSTKEFIKRAKEKHGDKYDYSLTEYKRFHDKVKIICPIHGEIEQAASAHLAGKGCYLCYGPKRGMSMKLKVKEFIQKVNKIHNNKYDYSLVNEIKGKTKISIICPEHGIFKQSYYNHYRNACPKCARKRTKKGN